MTGNTMDSYDAISTLWHCQYLWLTVGQQSPIQCCMCVPQDHSICHTLFGQRRAELIS